MVMTLDKSHKYGRKMKRHGQIQMGETVAVVIIVIILLVVGIAFWGRMSRANIGEIQEQSEELSVIEIANLVSELPELKCYEAGVSKVKCLDKYKILSMRDAMSDDAVLKYYNSYFMNSRITIMTIYPDVSLSQQNITIYDAEINNKTTTLQISIPVNIVDDVNKVTSYGMIIVEGYYRE
jgi:hypothetical protein